MSDSTGQSNSGKPYAVDDRRVVVIGGHPHDVWPIAHEPSNMGICIVILAREDRADETFAERVKTANHVAACLNACDGINPEAVPELVKAAENAIGMMQMAWKQYGVGGMFECMDALRSSLAKAKEGVA